MSQLEPVPDFAGFLQNLVVQHLPFSCNDTQLSRISKVFKDMLNYAGANTHGDEHSSQTVTCIFPCLL